MLEQIDGRANVMKALVSGLTMSDSVFDIAQLDFHEVRLKHNSDAHLLILSNSNSWNHFSSLRIEPER